MKPEELTEQEKKWIEDFLAKKEATACPDVIAVNNNGTSRRANNINMAYNIAGIRSRACDKFTCQICGVSDSVVKDERFGNVQKGYVNGIYRGNAWCTSCRKKAIKDQGNKTQSFSEKMKIKHKLETEENYELYKKLLSIHFATIEKYTVSELSKYISDVEFIVTLHSNKNLKQRLAKANTLKQIYLKGK
jgi:hypothetical protein